MARLWHGTDAGRASGRRPSAPAFGAVRGGRRPTPARPRARRRRRSRAARRAPPRRRSASPPAPPPAAPQPEREVRRQRGGVRAPRAVGGAAGLAVAGDLDQPLAVEEDVRRLVAVAPGHDDRARAQRVHGAGEVRGRRGRPRRRRRARAPRRGWASTTVARGSSRSTSAPRAAGSSSVAPDSATITGSSTTGVPGASRLERLLHGADRRARRRASRS